MNNKMSVYIIGNIPNELNFKSIDRFLSAEKQLNNFHLNVVNPARALLNSELSREEINRKNFLELINSKAIYLLNEDEEFYKKSLELKIANKLNLIIIHQPIVFINI